MHNCFIQFKIFNNIIKKVTVYNLKWEWQEIMSNKYTKLVNNTVMFLIILKSFTQIFGQFCGGLCLVEINILSNIH